MGKRRKGREIVLQACYASQVAGTPLTTCLADQLSRRQPAAETAAFARQLANKLAAHLDETDRWLARLLEHWRPERVGAVERSILQLALTELRYSPDVPWRVVINEALDVAGELTHGEGFGYRRSAEKVELLEHDSLWV